MPPRSIDPLNRVSARTRERAHRAGRNVDRLGSWALELQARTNHNKATCALANKLARIAWAVWAKHERYQPAL